MPHSGTTVPNDMHAFIGMLRRAGISHSVSEHEGFDFYNVTYQPDGDHPYLAFRFDKLTGALRYAYCAI